jgi:hypothetical protein
VKEPRRLLQSDDAPAALRDAMRALERRGPSPEALARLRASLPAGTPAAASGSGGAAAGGGSGAGAGAGAGGAAVAGVSLGSSYVVLLALVTSGALALYGVSALPRAATPQSGPATAKSAQSRASVDADAAGAAPIVASSGSTGRADDHDTSAAQRDAREPDTSHAARARRGLDLPSSRNVARERHSLGAPRDTRDSHVVAAPFRRGTTARPEPDQTSPAGSEPIPQLPEAEESTSPIAQPLAAPDPLPAQRPAVSAQPSAAKPASSAVQPELAPQDEAGLLYRAKRLAVREPRAALRLLASHAEHFPQGALAEERDVLAIQLHRKLGDAATVQRLAAQFRVRYPDSMYLRSLNP